MPTTRATIGNLFKTLVPAYENPAAIQDALKVYHFGVTDPDGVTYDPDSIEGHFKQAHDELDVLENRPVSMARVGAEPTAIPDPLYVSTPKIADALPDGYIWVDSGQTSGAFNTWITSIQVGTPTSSTDGRGSVGDVLVDDSYLYAKTSTGWKRTAITSW